MKKTLLPLLFIAGTLFFILSSHFVFRSDEGNIINKAAPVDSLRFSRSHDTYPENARNPILPPMNIPGSTISDYDHLSMYTNVDISNDTAPQNETSVKISRKHPNRVVAAWRDFRTGVTPAVRRVGYSYSTDAGATWSVSTLLSLPDSTHPRTSDPAVCVDTAGNFYIATISPDVSNNNGEILVYKSTNEGVTFPISSIFWGGSPNFEDKEYITCDLTTGSSPYKNNLYISWTRFGTSSGIRLIRSTNGGTNWSSLIVVSDAGHSGQGSDPAVGANGQVYVVWVGGTYTTDIIYFDKSTNGGQSFGTDVVVSQGNTPNIPISSSDVTFPSIATDISGGSRNGYIYVTWCDARNGDPDIFCSRSTNDGVNWSTAVRVNNDGLGNGKLQCWPWIASDNAGNIAIIFYDSRNTSSNTIIEAYLARSTDGGLTFTNELLSTQPSPTNQPNSDVRFGDYIGIDYWNGVIVPVWTDERAGGFNMEAYTAIVNLIGIQPISNPIPDGYRLYQNYPNPFNPATTINFSIPKATNITLKIYNSIGQVIETLIDGEVYAGTHSIKWNADKYSSGIYFYRLEAQGFSKTMKMLLLK
jgi:hypothetical protein